VGEVERGYMMHGILNLVSRKGLERKDEKDLAAPVAYIRGTRIMSEAQCGGG